MSRHSARAECRDCHEVGGSSRRGGDVMLGREDERPRSRPDLREAQARCHFKADWLAHKEIYETCVLAPMAELLAELEAEHGETKIYRPYRDVRFSKDK